MIGWIISLAMLVAVLAVAAILEALTIRIQHRDIQILTKKIVELMKFRS